MITHGDDLQAGDYVLNLNTSAPFAHKVTRVAETSIDTRIQVSSLYGDDWVLAAAFFKVSGPTPTKAEIFRFNEARAIAQRQALEEGYQV